MIRALLFDMDGLMIDSERLYFDAEREIARRYGREVRDETLWKMMGRKPLESLEIYVQDTGLPITAQGEFLDLVVDHLDIRATFDLLQSSDDIRSGKPDPEIFLTACRRLNLSPDECLVLEDSGNGVLAGRRAGCRVVAVPSDFTRTHDFSPADYIAADLFEATDYIESVLRAELIRPRVRADRIRP
jgi:beta-phosphoglucomutase-like phosphatase (HAD superfamily)